ncbi:MAG: hypothetical protein WBA41_00600 [Rivularia sp. (in: cyanobacteria)]
MSIWEFIGDTTNARRGFVKELYEELEYSIREELKDSHREQSHLKNEINKLKAENDKLKLVVTKILTKSVEKGVFAPEEIESLCKDIGAEN